ncbi:MAG: DUF1194 domain-containing protein [Pseudomonadota bacterium]
MIRAISRAIVAISLFIAGSPVHSCEIALAFAVDVSASITSRIYRSQLDGLAAAVRDPLIASELERANASLTLVQWTGKHLQEVSIPWTPMRSAADVESFAVRTQQVPRAWRGTNTAIGAMLDFTNRVFDDAPDCYRRVLDVSGNGPSNEGDPPETRRPALVAAGITINAIVVDIEAKDLAGYYANNVIGGIGAFVITAEDISDYAEKMRQKLFRELAIQMAASDR